MSATSTFLANAVARAAIVQRERERARERVAVPAAVQDGHMHALVIGLEVGERLVVRLRLPGGGWAAQYAVVENRPPLHETGDGRQLRPRPDACGAVAMKHPQGTGSFSVLGLTTNGYRE